MKVNSRIYVVGHTGLAGSAMLRRLEAEGFDSVLTATREQLDLRDQAAVNYWFKANRPEFVFLVAGTVGGILANSTRPAEFICDNFDLASSHVLPAMIRRFHEAKRVGCNEVVLWGTGTPRREFLHVDDLADACLFLMRHYDESEHINVGTGVDQTIRGLAELVASIVHPGATLRFDASKPDGMPQKLLDVSRLHELGWQDRIGLEDGIASAYRWFLDHLD